jgi:hypothetical protein
VIPPRLLILADGRQDSHHPPQPDSLPYRQARDQRAHQLGQHGAVGLDTQEQGQDARNQTEQLRL